MTGTSKEKMEDLTAPFNDTEDSLSATVCRECALYDLELKYWSIKTLRKIVRYMGCLVLTGQLVAAIFCFIASPWADITERSRSLRLMGCLLLSTLSASCFLFSLAAVGVAWATSMKAHVCNALLFAGFHVKSLAYSSCACATSAALLKCIGLQMAPLNLVAGIAFTCLILFQLLLQPVSLGGFWAVCVAGFLFFLVGSQHLFAALAEGTLPRGVFAFVGFSHLWWLSPLIAAATLAAMLLLCHFLELLLAIARGGHHIFCPPNSHLYSLDDLAKDAAQGRPLSMPLYKPRRPPSVAAFRQLFRENLSPRLQGPAMAQQRRTVGGPASASSRPAAANKEVVGTELKPDENPPQRKASSEGTWLVALWLRGPFFLASLGALCIALSVGLYAMVSDSEAAFHGRRGVAAFDGLSQLLLPTQQLPLQQVEISFATVQQQISDGGGGTIAAGNVLQQQQQHHQKHMLLPANQHRRWQQRSLRLSQVLQAPTLPSESFASDTSRDSSFDGSNPKETPGNSFLHLRRLDGPQGDKTHHQHGMKSAAALLLLALVLLTPLLASSFGEWIEDIFFAHMVLIKRNPWMIVPPPTLAVHPQTHVLEPTTAKEAASPCKNSSDPLLYMAREQITQQTARNFLGLGTQPKQEQRPEQQNDHRLQHEQKQQP